MDLQPLPPHTGLAFAIIAIVARVSLPLLNIFHLTTMQFISTAITILAGAMCVAHYAFEFYDRFFNKSKATK